jgi:hypothetical protein
MAIYRKTRLNNVDCPEKFHLIMWIDGDCFFGVPRWTNVDSNDGYFNRRGAKSGL